jgi:hypothetical protein
VLSKKKENKIEVEGVDVVEIQMHNLRGEVVRTSSVASVSTALLPAGVYFLSVYIQGGVSEQFKVML